MLTADTTRPIKFSNGVICYNWSKVTTADSGKYMCVYGFVRAS
jgi:hypothetical protein